MQLLRRKEFYYLIILDTMCIFAALSLSIALKFDFVVPASYKALFNKTFLFIIPLKLVTFFSLGLYQRIWQHAGMEDYLKSFIAVTSASILIFTLEKIFKFNQLTTSIILIDFFLTLILVNGSRISVRIFNKVFDKYKVFKSGNQAPLKRILIYGAGVGGEQIIREIERNNYLRYEVIGFIDDDDKKKGMIIQNVKVLGKREDINRLISKYKIEVILIAIPVLKGKAMRELINYLEQFPVEIRTLPSQSELIDGNVYVNQIRPVQIEDLLGREIIDLDTTSISQYLTDKNILITGAGGSIGSELARQVIQFSPKNLLLLGKGENSIFNITRELKECFPELNIKSIIADIGNYNRITQVMKKEKPNIVFHAAAHKHVYLMEVNPVEAFKNNVLGSMILMRCSEENGVERYVQISTDKAVNPTNIMGATKLLTERVMLEFTEKSNCIFSAVRFGNVLGSRGSVIPIFKSQIEKGGPVTVTHPDALRYFMTIPEASQLVLQAGGHAMGGEIFILDMGKPVKILDLALDLIRFSGFEPYEEIDIEFIGLRPGEKLIEELLTDEEGISATKYKKIFIAPKKENNQKPIIKHIDTFSQTMYNLSNEKAKQEIFKLIEK